MYLGNGILHLPVDISLSKECLSQIINDTKSDSICYDTEMVDSRNVWFPDSRRDEKCDENVVYISLCVRFYWHNCIM